MQFTEEMQTNLVSQLHANIESLVQGVTKMITLFILGSTLT